MLITGVGPPLPEGGAAPADETPLVVSNCAISEEVSRVMSSRCGCGSAFPALPDSSKTTNALANLRRIPAMPQCRLCWVPPQGLARFGFGPHDPPPCD